MGKAAQGRPPKSSESTQVPLNVQGNIQQVITDQPDSEEILKIIAFLCQYMNVSKTGQKRKKLGAEIAREEQTLQDSSCQINEKVKTELEPMGTNGIKQYFLRSLPHKFKLYGEYLIDETEYVQIKDLDRENYDPDYRILYERMNLVAKALDGDFIEILKPIIEKYITLKKQRELDILNQILLEINNNQAKYQYLLNWQRLKDLTKRTRYNRHVFELKLTRQKVEALKSKKVIQKHMKNIEKDLKVLKEQYEAEPLAYLMGKLIERFDIILAKQSDPDFQSSIDSAEEQ